MLNDFHKNINLWLFWLKSTYGCFSGKSLIIRESKISIYGCFNIN